MIYQAPELPAIYLKVIEEIGRLREQLRYFTSDSLNRWTRLMARTTAARVMIGTNAIEGVNVTRDDAMAAIDGEAPLSPDDENTQAIMGYQRAMTYIVQLSKDPTYIHNEGTIKSLHYMLLSHDLAVNPGRWRPGGIHITNTATQQVVYEGPESLIVPGLMTELIASLQSTDLPSLVQAAMAHLNLTMIHPFSDGNGRMARALQTMVLSREGILDPSFSSIEEYIGRHSADYYAVLAEVGKGSWHPENDPLPWIRFSLTAHYRQAIDLLRRTTDLGKLWNALEAIVKKKKINDRVVNALADAAMGYKIRNPTYRQQAEVSNQVAKNDLKLLADTELLIPMGEKRGRFYVASDTILEVRKATKTVRSEPDPFVDFAESVSLQYQPGLPGFSGAG